MLSSSVQATTGDFSQSVASQFSSSYATIYSISSSTNTTIDNLSSSIATSLSASNVEQTLLSGAISTTINNLSSSFDTTINNLSSSIVTALSASAVEQTLLSGAISTTINNLSSSIYTTISSSDATFAAFSSSIDGTILNKMNLVGVISSSTQLDGSTLRNITIAPINSDGYSLTISGALAIVNATGLPDGGFGDLDSTVPGQIYLDGNPTTASVAPPVDPSTNNKPNSNIIDMGEF